MDSIYVETAEKQAAFSNQCGIPQAQPTEETFLTGS
jgi:hypothetical protein